MAEKKHKVRDVAAKRHDREVTGTGHYGIASGGLRGDGDVELVRSPGSAKNGVLDYFAELIRADEPMGTLVRTRYISKDQARKYAESVDAQLECWHETVDGHCIDVEIEIEGFTTLRVGIFRCWWGDTTDGGRHIGNAWTIPQAVRLPYGTTRVAKVP